MPIVVGIRFKDSGKIYYFDPLTLELSQGEAVIVETVRGLELAKVALEQREVAESDIVGELKPVVRRAEAIDLERQRALQARHEEVLARCAEKVREHALPMNLVKAEYSFDGSRLTFYFTAEKRVDFRLLVRDLARTFKSRIELRQIGPRDEAKLIGGIGPCGRLLCCATFLPDYARVSIKMAKDQDLPLNPAKISGVCGRLLCCLSYEHETYLELRTLLPRKGLWVQSPDGPGEVVSVNVLKQEVTVQLASSGMHVSYPSGDVVEATSQVAAVARNRNDEGVTPAAARRDTQRRERGERRLLRDEMEGDMLEALAFLEEEGEDMARFQFDDSPPSAAPAQRNEPSARTQSPPQRPPRQQNQGGTPPRTGERTPPPPGGGVRSDPAARQAGPRPPSRQGGGGRSDPAARQVAERSPTSSARRPPPTPTAPTEPRNAPARQTQPRPTSPKEEPPPTHPPRPTSDSSIRHRRKRRHGAKD